MTKGPFRYDIVGSFLRPESLKAARNAYANHEISKEELTEVENAAIETLIKKEIEAGLKAVTDGEFRRRWWHLDFIASLNGISVYDFETEGFGMKMSAQGTYVSASLSFPEDHPFLEHYRFTHDKAYPVLAKQTIPGPNMIYLDSLILSKHYRENPIYTDLELFKKDLIQTYQDAISAFYKMGCRYLQLDDTSWGALFDDRFRGLIQMNGFDPDALIEEFAEITQASIQNKPDDMTLTFHLCKGNFKSHWLYSGSYDRIAERLLALTQFDGFFLEYDDERSGGFEPLRYLKDQKIVLGLVTSKKGDMESESGILNRIQDASRYVNLNQICISPQCGFSSTEEGNRITEADQWKKLGLIRTVADTSLK